MPVIEVINKNPLNLSELSAALDSLSKRDGELNFRGKRLREYLNAFEIPTLKEADALKKKINDLQIPRLKDRHIAKLIDLHPADMDSLKLLFSTENITLKQEDFEKILSALT
ncbi:MAG: hypothetical protein AABW49_03525 [Nanoarchaeota archaeon]